MESFFKFISILCCAVISGCADNIGLSNRGSDLLNNTPLIIYDHPITGTNLKNYRNTSDYFSEFNNSKDLNYSIVGLDTLYASASAQFSEEGFVEIQKRAKSNLVVVDLRQESHGFINGTPIVWYGFRNQYNLNKSPKQIEREEDYLLAGLEGVGKATIHISKKDYIGNMIPKKSNIINIRKVQSEDELVSSYGVQYKRLYVLDHHRPTNLQVDDFVNFIKSLPDEKWVHFHCRGGIGRATTFMTMYDMIHNVDKVKMEDLILRQREMLNFVRQGQDILKKEREWKVVPALERADFIQNFYKYVKDPDGYISRSWSDWVKKNKIK